MKLQYSYPLQSDGQEDTKRALKGSSKRVMCCIPQKNIGPSPPNAIRWGENGMQRKFQEKYSYLQGKKEVQG